MKPSAPGSEQNDDQRPPIHGYPRRGARGYRLAGLLLLCGPGLLVSACGGANGAAASGAAPTRESPVTSRSAFAAATHPARPPSTHAQALAFARAVNLSVSDIPEASLVKRRHEPSSTREKREYAACERLAPHGHIFFAAHLAEVSSPSLKRGQELEIEQIASSVRVLKQERTIASEFAAMQGPAVRACLARALTRNFSEKSVREARWGHFTISKLPIDAPGASATFGIRVTVALTFPFVEVAVPIYVDVLGFSVGPAEVALSATSITQPIPAATEQELVTLLLARAKAHPLQ